MREYLVLQLRPIGQNFFLNKFNVSGGDEIHAILIYAVGNTVHNAGNAGVDQNLGAINAREVGDVTSGAASGNTVQGGLDDGICLGVDSTNAVPIYEQVTGFIAMGLPGW